MLWPIRVNMAEHKKLVSTRQGFRAHLTKMLQNLDEHLNKQEPLSKEDSATLKDIYDQLEWKEEVISRLDAKILKGITNDDDIEKEIVETEEIHSSISTARAKILCHLSPTTSTESTIRRPEVHTSPPEHVTCLPKLNLPQFSAGNPLHWQSFWDCFRRQSTATLPWLEHKNLVASVCNCVETLLVSLLVSS